MIPESWAKIRERRRFSTANGWETVETWTGPAGPNEATVNQWLANFSGYTSLEIEHSLPTDDGNSVVTAEIGFGISGADGHRLPPEHPDYGLISRKWTKHTNRVPISLLAHPSVKPLHDTDADWPERLRLQAMAYAIALRQYMRGERDEKPDADSFRTAARPDGFSSDQFKDIEVWLFREFAADEDAHYEASIPVLRKTEEVISATRLRAIHENTNRILTYDALQRIETSLSLAVIINTAELSGWYWLKASPEVEETGGGRFLIVQEYEGVAYLAPNTIMRYGPPIT
jgi:hypothetical protein